MKLDVTYIASRIFVGLAILFYIFGLYGRSPHTDDAWIGEQVYWLSHGSHVKNVLMKNYNQNEVKLLVYHKLWVWQGWIATKLFGFSLYVLKSISLLYLLVLLGLLYFYMVKKKKLLKKHEFYPVATIFLLHPLVFRYSFVYRPEIALATVGFLIFIILEDRLEHNKRGYGIIFIIGLLSCMAFLIHLNGLIYVGGTAVLLLIYKRYGDFTLYTIIVILLASLYFIDIHTKSDFYLWRSQLTFFTETGNGSLSIGKLISSAFYKLFDEHLRWYHSPAEITYSVVFLIVVIKGYYLLKKEAPTLLYFTIITTIILAFIGINKTVKYILLLLPFYFVLTVYYFKVLPEHYDFLTFFNPKKKYLITRIIIILAILTGLYYDGVISINKFNPTKYKQLTDTYIKDDPKKVIVLAPMQFIFNELNKYKAIVGLFSYQERLEKTKGFTQQAFFSTAKSDSIDYIFLNKYNRKLFHINVNSIGDTLYGFRLIGKKDNFTIMKRTYKN